MAPRATVRPKTVVFLNSALSQIPDEHRKKPACIMWYLLPEEVSSSVELHKSAPRTALHQPSVL